jgi:hypothetical protein
MDLDLWFSLSWKASSRRHGDILIYILTTAFQAVVLLGFHAVQVADESTPT